MAKMSSVFLGFLLTLVVYLFFGRYEFWGLLIVGFIVGYIAHEGIFGVSSLFIIIYNIIKYMITMGITGALGGALTSKKD